MAFSKIGLKSILLFFLLFAVACDDPREEPHPHPEPENPPVPEPDGPNSFVYLSLTATPWLQDSLSAVYVAFSEITLKATEGFEWTRKVDSTKLYNLLDLSQFPVALVNDTIVAARYTACSLKMRSFMLQEKDRDKHKDWDWFWDWDWYDDDDHGRVMDHRYKIEYKVPLSHYPPGNHAKVRAIGVDVCSVQDHLKHGDTPGGGKHTTAGYSKGSKLFNHMVYKKDKAVTPLFMKEDLIYKDTIDIDIPEGNEVDARLTIDVAKSIFPFLVKKKRYDNDHDHDDDHDGHGHGRDKDHDHDDDDEKSCKYVWLFNPAFDLVILPRVGKISGNYEGTLAAGRTYNVYLYPAGKYVKTEENVNNPFPNALKQTVLTAQRTFLLENVKVGTYDLILAEFQAGRFRTFVNRADNVTVLANKTVPATIKRR